MDAITNHETTNIPAQTYNFLGAEPCHADGFAFPKTQDKMPDGLIKKVCAEPVEGGVLA